MFDSDHSAAGHTLPRLEGFRPLLQRNGISLMTYTSAAGTPSDQPSVLIIEGDLETRVLYRCLLEPGYDLTVTGDLDEARATLAGGAESSDTPPPFDLVLATVTRDDPQGDDLLRMLRRVDGGSHGPIVAVTAYGLAGDADWAPADGFDACLHKPFSRTELIDTIESARARTHA